jgi:hypothetical protein
MQLNPKTVPLAVIALKAYSICLYDYWNYVLNYLYTEGGTATTAVMLNKEKYYSQLVERELKMVDNRMITQEMLTSPSTSKKELKIRAKSICPGEKFILYLGASMIMLENEVGFN